MGVGVAPFFIEKFPLALSEILVCGGPLETLGIGGSTPLTGFSVTGGLKPSLITLWEQK